MADVRAKMFVAEVGQTTYGGKLVMRPVTRGDDNKAWSQATPSGELTLTIRNELAMERFRVGDEWFLDFTKVPDELANTEGMG
jgi:hypothetical protein